MLRSYFVSLQLPSLRNGGAVNSIIELYPNPARNQVYLYLKAREGLEGSSLFISGIDGKIVYQGILPAGVELREINVSDYSAGIYTVSVVWDGKIIETKRLEVVK